MPFSDRFGITADRSMQNLVAVPANTELDDMLRRGVPKHVDLQGLFYLSMENTKWSVG